MSILELKNRVQKNIASLEDEKLLEYLCRLTENQLLSGEDWEEAAHVVLERSLNEMRHKMENITEEFSQNMQDFHQQTIEMMQEEKPKKPTSFREFSFSQVLEAFNLNREKQNLFENIEQIEASVWLQHALKLAKQRPLRSEKERSETLISPILSEVQERNDFSFQIFSGEFLVVDKDKGLKGEFDFAFVNDKQKEELTAPIFTLVEAKQADITKHWGQITAQMVAAREENKKANKELSAIFGAITSGENWQFAKLENECVYIDTETYYLVQIEKILGIFQYIVDFYKE